MLKGRTALVTGGSRGIGAAIAEKLASLGADVALVYAGNAAAAETVRARCEALGVRAQAFQCDVKDFAAVKETVSAVKKAFGGLDILVNNAGVTRDGLVLMMKEQDYDEVLDTNLKGCFNFIRHASPLLLRSKAGRIVNISSAAGVMGNAGQANYSASKAGVIGLTKAVARELASKGVTCNAVAPGFIRTDMTKSFDETDPLVASIPLKRMGQPEEVAEAVAFLVGDGAAYITGQVLGVDGGMAM